MDDNNQSQNQEVANNGAEVQEQKTELIKHDPAKPVAHIKHMKEIALASVAVALLAVFALVAVMLSNREESDYKVADQDLIEDEVQAVELASAVTIVKGQVEKSLDGETWAAVAVGDSVNVGDSIRTLNDGRTVLLLDDGSAVRLDSNTEIKLSVSDTLSTDIMLIQGEVYSRVVESESRVFAVVTETERFIAQGTAYSTSTDGVKDELEVYQSKVLVDSQKIDIEEGNKYDSDSKSKSSLDIDKLKDDSFVAWNKDLDEKNSDYKDKLGVLDIAEKEEEKEVEKDVTPEPAPVQPAEPVPVQPAASISLNGSQSDSGVSLSWSLNNGASGSNGFKVVYDKFSSAPTYQVHKSQYVGAGSASAFVKLKDGETYNFRVCAYRSNGTCDTYSNAVTVTAPIVEVEQVQSGAVSLSITDRNISWTFAGTAPHGFKVVLNEDGAPSYPANSIQYLGAGSTSYQLPEKPPGTYFVKVCKYTTSGCTDYSNEVTYIVE